jgi:hypothetical protein
MAKKLSRHGNSLALIIDKPLPWLLKTKGKRNKSEIKTIAQEIIDEYADVFKKLAK